MNNRGKLFKEEYVPVRMKWVSFMGIMFILCMGMVVAKPTYNAFSDSVNYINFSLINVNDSNYLDGIDSSGFMRNPATSNLDMNGYNITASNEFLKITATGGVGIVDIYGQKETRLRGDVFIGGDTANISHSTTFNTLEYNGYNIFYDDVDLYGNTVIDNAFIYNKLVPYSSVFNASIGSQSLAFNVSYVNNSCIDGVCISSWADVNSTDGFMMNPATANLQMNGYDIIMGAGDKIGDASGNNFEIAGWGGITANGWWSFGDDGSDTDVNNLWIINQFVPYYNNITLGASNRYFNVSYVNKSCISGTCISSWADVNSSVGGSADFTNVAFKNESNTFVKEQIINGHNTNRPYLEIQSYTNDYTNTGGQNTAFHLNNTHATGQTSFDVWINNQPMMKFRSDYVGDLTWASYATAATAGHYFYTGGDYPTGKAKMKISPSGVVIGDQVAGSAPDALLEIEGTSTRVAYFNDSIISFNRVLKLESISIPSCSATYAGGIARNATKLYYCDGTIWNALY